MLSTTPATSAWLVRLSGPAITNLQLNAKEGGVSIGRHEQCDIQLPPDAEKVSRFHARFLHDEHGWQITDLGSRWGTFVNGYKVGQGQVLPLSEGDLIRITPWTFSFSLADRGRSGFDSVDDSAMVNTFVRQVASGQGGKLQDELLGLLLEAAAGIHAAEDEKTLAEVVLEEACRGSGLTNAAWLRPVDADGRIDVVATKSVSQLPQRAALYSRTLLQTASQGVVAELSGNMDSANTSESIVANRINAAICVPLMLGQTIAAYIYLDSRGGMYSQSGTFRGARPNASAFCLALGRIASLALSNLKRKDIEARHASIQADLNAGAEAQRWILPKREAHFGALSYIGESRPGLHLGGDFFDVIPLPGDRLAVSLGDVTGKGVAASVLMTTTQGFLHAALAQHGEPKRAVMDLCRFIYPRRPESKFVTLWIGVFDAATRTLRYVDAGHGHALLAHADGSTEPLSGGGGLPIGIMEESDYDEQTVTLAPGGRALIVSDGIIEQFRPTGVAEPTPEDQFGIDRTAQILSDTKSDEDTIRTLFQAVFTHAQSERLADDATAVLVRW
jgi:phosphoserine phosphatase RsbU/P